MTNNDTGTVKKSGRGHTVFAIVVLALIAALILTAIFVPLGIYRSRGEVMISHGTVTVRRDLYVYWLSAYKYSYLTTQSRVDPAASDTPAYWNAEAEPGVTNAEKVRAEADARIKRIVFAASLFEEEDLSLGEKMQDELDAACKRLFQYGIEGEKDFDRAAKPIGFKYKTVRRAVFYETEGESYVRSMTEAQFEFFCSVAESEVTLEAAAETIDFASLPTDSRLYCSAITP